ncbi:MAG TPA: hypothetical protein VEX36_12645 [Thermoleophilaceae bacterium]|nr:hypothetical protein [Thermoleophilaceae bacterium]
MKRALRHFVLLAALLALVPATAAATSPNTILQDCLDSDSLEGDYSNRDLNEAVKLVRGDRAEYSNCKAIILAARKGRKAGAGKGVPPDADLNNDGVVTPKEKRIAKQRARAARREQGELAAIGDSLSPDDADASGTGGAGGSGGSSLPMILTLIALALVAVGGGLWYTAKRNPAVANALRRVPLPGKHS